MHFVSVHTPYLAAEEKCNEVRVNDDDDDIDEDGDGGGGDDFDGDIKVVFVLINIPGWRLPGGHLGQGWERLCQVRPQRCQPQGETLSPQDHHNFQNQLCHQHCWFSNKTILRMGPTTGLEVWMQIGTRDSSGFLEPRWWDAAIILKIPSDCFHFILKLNFPHFCFFFTNPFLTFILFESCLKVFTDFKQNEPAGSPYLHMNFDAQFK